MQQAPPEQCALKGVLRALIGPNLAQVVATVGTGTDVAAPGLPEATADATSAHLPSYKSKCICSKLCTH